MTEKEERNINLLKMAAELSKDTLEKQWSSIDSLIQRSALIITSIVIFLGFLLQMPVKNINAVKFYLYVSAILVLIIAFVSASLSFRSLKVAINTKIEDLKKLSEKDEETFLRQIVSNNEDFIKKNREQLNRRWHCFRLSIIFYVVAVILIVAFKFIQT